MENYILFILQHFSKAIWKRVAGNKMTSFYSKNIKLTILVRMAIGLPYVPLDRINEGLEILKQEAQNVTGPASVKKFAVRFVKYIEKTWINGNYEPSTWNYYLRRGVNTNNYAEGNFI